MQGDMRHIIFFLIFLSAAAAPGEELVPTRDQKEAREDGRVLATTGWWLSAIASVQVIVGGLLVGMWAKAGPTDDSVFMTGPTGFTLLAIGATSLIGALPVAISGEVRKRNARSLSLAPTVMHDGAGAQLSLRF
jgi:hypothetical protein